jgi:hypothetical protein
VPAKSAGFFIGENVLQQSLRVRCRNQRCRTKLPIPTSNDHKAFCSRYCYDQFYHLKCAVCEKPVAKRPRGKTPKWCIKRDCRLTFNRFRDAFEYKPHIHAQSGRLTSEVPLSQGAKGLTNVYRGGIVGPRSVIQAAVINAHDWEEVVSPDGVVSYVSRIGKRALQEAA